MWCCFVDIAICFMVLDLACVAMFRRERDKTGLNRVWMDCHGMSQVHISRILHIPKSIIPWHLSLTPSVAMGRVCCPICIMTLF